MGVSLFHDDQMTMYYKLRDNVYDEYISRGKDQPFQVNKDRSIDEYGGYQTGFGRWELKAEKEEFEFEGKEEIDGKKAVKLKRTESVPEEETLTFLVVNGGGLTKEQINENEMLKKAIEENKKGIKISYYWFDEKTHDLIQQKSDLTTDLIINYFVRLQNDSGNTTEAVDTAVPESWTTITKYIWPEKYEPVQLPENK